MIFAFSHPLAFTISQALFTSGIPLYGIGSTPIMMFPALPHSSFSFCAVCSTEYLSIRPQLIWATPKSWHI